MKITDNKISSKKVYVKPLITKVCLDNSITLMMTSPGPPSNPGVRGGGGGGGSQSDPFASPFDNNKPFN